MTDLEKVTEIAADVAKANLGPKNVLRVVSEPTTDSEGQEALHLLIVIAPGVAARFNGDEVLDTLVQILNRLRDAGEERFPIIEYATEAELADIDSP
jgi:hypothetical protein